jgi:predicted PurR-regulated permease PerM
MTSDTEWPELKEQLERWGAREERNRRVALAIVAIITAGIIMAVGVVVIGGAEEVHRTSDTAYSYWNTPQLEIGIFITLIGTVMMALSANFLTKSWRISQVRKGKGG